MIVTRNHQSPEALQALCATAFPGREMTAITELTEGLFNVAYRVDFADVASVLKIADANTSVLLSSKVGMMMAGDAPGNGLGEYTPDFPSADKNPPHRTHPQKIRNPLQFPALQTGCVSV